MRNSNDGLHDSEITNSCDSPSLGMSEDAENDSPINAIPHPPLILTTRRMDDGRSNDAFLPLLEDLDSEEDSIAITGVRLWQTYSNSIRRHDRSIISIAFVAKFFACLLLLWFSEFTIVVSLKRAGVVTQEFGFEEKIAQMVIPQLEQGWNMLNEFSKQEKLLPGYHLAQQGARANYPIVLIPGFVTSGLQVWGGKTCAKKYFRQRLWAALVGARSFLMERDCWQQHMMLDPLTGGDPSDIRVRAAEGFEAADFFMANYWVWGKLIENLAYIGYDPSTMSMEPYDWRLSFPMLEKRDGYLTKLKLKIEAMRKTNKKKVVLTSHSMGGLLVHYFFAWVTTGENKGGGGGGKDWVEKNVHSYINIAGSHLGVPKAATALLSGEMSDTTFRHMGTMGSVMEQFFGRRLRRDLWNTWGSLWGMLPKGGDALWGTGADICSDRTSNDPFCPKSSEFSPLLMATDTQSTANKNASCSEETLAKNTLLEFASREAHFTEEMLDFLQRYGGGLGPNTSASREYSLYGNEKSSSRTWHDPTKTPLPRAPSLRIYCFYGTGIDTERAYYYKGNDEQDGDDLPLVLDAKVQNENQNVRYGVRYSDGDGSVPLISLGYMCVDAWKRKGSGLNPGPSDVFTREYEHRKEFCVDDPMRGGPASADHIDILGNIEMTTDFLRVVTDFDSSVVRENRLVSNIEEISHQINSHPRGGIHKLSSWFPGI